MRYVLSSDNTCEISHCHRMSMLNKFAVTPCSCVYLLCCVDFVLLEIPHHAMPEMHMFENFGFEPFSCLNPI